METFQLRHYIKGIAQGVVAALVVGGVRMLLVYQLGVPSNGWVELIASTIVIFCILWMYAGSFICKNGWPALITFAVSYVAIDSILYALHLLQIF